MNFKSNCSALTTIVHREVTRFTRIWTQTLIPSVITQGLYFAIFGKFIGSHLPDIHGISYVAFIVPGLIMMSVINNSFSNVVSSFFSNKFQRSIEELLVSPTPDWVIVAGYASGGVLRGLCVGILVFFVSFLFTELVIFNIGWILLFIVLTAIVFSLGGLLNAIFARSFDDISVFPMFVLTPMIYLGGVFYSIHDLPPFWQAVSQFNPVLYMVNGFRYGFYGVSDVSVWLSLLILVAFMLILTASNLYLLQKGIGLKS